MMSKVKLPRERLLWYLIPTLAGMVSVLFSNQFDDPLFRFIVVLASVAMPVFASGVLLARSGAKGIGRFVLLGGVVLLLVGAAGSFLEFSETFAEQKVLLWNIKEGFRAAGMISLLLGLFLVLFSIVRTGEATQELAVHFRHLAGHISEGFILFSPDGAILLVNQPFLDMSGLSEGEVVGKNVGGLVKRLQADGLMPYLEFRSQESASEYETTWSVRGEERQFWFSETPILDRNGRHTSTLATVRDVTERNRMAQRLEEYAEDLQRLVEEQTNQLEKRAAELEAANEELRSHGRAKDGFLSNVSHELRTPLSTIQGYIEMIETGSLGPLEPPQVNALHVMERNLQRLMALINEMLEFSRMEIRGVSLRLVLLDPARLVHENIASVQPQAFAKKVQIHCVVPDDFLVVWGDHQRIGQVLTILLSNAIKFSHEGGTIEVRVAQDCNNTFTIAVRDTGIGIDPAYHARVFDKFYQVDSSMTRRYEGAGIGLSIAKSITEAHGGTIRLESQINKGSTFTMVLPNAVFDATLPGIAEPQLGLRVLAVSKSESLCRVIRTVLVACGCAVDEAHDQHECIRLAEEVEPDIVLLSEPLSDEGGLGTVSMLRQNPATDTIPILSFSGFGALNREKDDGALPNVYPMSIPFSARELVARIRQICFGESTRPDAVLDVEE